MAKRSPLKKLARRLGLAPSADPETLAAGVPDQIEIVGDGPVELLAGQQDLSAAEGEGQKRLRRFKMLAYSGGKMRPMGFFRDVVVDLKGLKVAPGPRPIHKEHDRREIVGHSEKIDVANTIRLEGVVSGVRDAAQEVVESSDNGFPWRSSIGARIHKMVFVDDGEKVEVNGRTFTGPLNLVREATLNEVSFVTMGGDDRTSATVAASAADLLEGSKMEFEAWLEAQGWNQDDLNEKKLATLRAAWQAQHGNPEEGDDAQKPAEVTAGGDVDDSTNDTSLIQATRDEIRAAAADEKARLVTISKKFAGRHPELEARAIGEGWSDDKIDLELLRASRPQAPTIHTADGSNRTAPAIEAALCLAAGMKEEDIADSYDERTMEAALSRELRGIGLQYVIHQSIIANGGHASPGRFDDETIQAALRLDPALHGIQASSGFTTFSLSGILGNVANKALLKSFRSVESVIHMIASRRPVKDFKQHESYRLTGTGEFLKIGPDGELKHGSLSEDKFTNQADTYGRIITLTRTDQVNDDLGAFLQMPRILGRGAALALQKAFYTLLLSNPSSFFSAGNKNYFEGADTNLQVTSLTTAEQKFLDQTDKNGDPVAITPGVLLTPSSEKVTGQQLFSERVVNETTTANKPKPANNPHAGKFTPVSTPYLNNSAYTGYSAKAWYLFADPNDVPAMEVAYLNGREMPVIQSAEANFNVLGIQWRGYFDFGVAMQEHRAAVKSKGEA